MSLEAVGIARRAGDRWLLDEVSLSVGPGQRLALAGPSGSGKTLFLRSLALLDPVDAGEVRWQEKPIRGSDVPQFRSRVVYLHQRPALIEGSVEDNLREPFALRVHRARRFDRSRVLRLLQSLDRSADFLSKQSRDLSGGETQLTALLRAMQLDPDVLLLDEPTAALDPAAAAMVESLVARWLDERRERAIVWVTHDGEQARRVATTALEMRDGRLAAGP